MKRSDRATNFLSGNLWKESLLFSLPLIGTNLLQILFNLSDLMVVGLFEGSDALGAVGSTSILVTLFTTFIIGNANGINSKVGKTLGENNKEEVKHQMTTSFYYMLLIGLIILGLGMGLSYHILSWLQTNAELIDDANAYLSIYFIAFPGVAIYNYGNAILSARGRTKKPLVILLISGLINVGLNFLFVIAFRLGVVGVALASVISQYISAIAIIIILLRHKGKTRLDLNPRHFSQKVLNTFLGLSLISGFQNTIFSFANLIVQIGVNSFDKTMISGTSASYNVDSIVYESMAAFYVAGCTFVAQNYGANHKKRILSAYLISVAYSWGIGFILGGLMWIFGRYYLYLFTHEEAVIEAGMSRLNIMALSYGVSAIMDAPIAASRGLGKTKWPTIFVLIGVCVFRITWIFTIFAHFHTVTSLFILYVFSFILTGIMENIYFFICYRKIPEKEQDIKAAQSALNSVQE